MTFCAALRYHIRTFEEGSVKLMRTSLKHILTSVAKEKGIDDVNRWAEERLAHCEVSTDYGRVYLKSSEAMRFGVRDAEFRCPPFVLYREMMNEDESPDLREFEIYAFTNLEDARFRQLMAEAYQDYFHAVEDVRLFYISSSVCFRIRTETGYAVLGDYNDLLEPLEIETDLYCLTLKFDPSGPCYFNSLDTLERQLIEIRDYFNEYDENGEAASDVITVTRMGEVLPVRLCEVGEKQWKVKI